MEHIAVSPVAFPMILRDLADFWTPTKPPHPMGPLSLSLYVAWLTGLVRMG